MALKREKKRRNVGDSKEGKREIEIHTIVHPHYTGIESQNWTHCTRISLSLPRNERKRKPFKVG